MKYKSATKDAVMVRAEHYRKFIANEIEDASDKDIESLSKMPIYFICSRLDVKFDRKRFDYIPIENNCYKLPLYFLDDFDDKRAIDLLVPSHIFKGEKVAFRVDSKDKRVLHVCVDGKETSYNVAINPTLRRYLNPIYKVVNIEYIGLSEASGVKGRFKNGHVGYDKALAAMNSNRESADVFILGFNVKNLNENDEEGVDIEAVEASLISFLKPEFNSKLKDFPPKDGPGIVTRLKGKGYSSIETTVYNEIESHNVVLDKFYFQTIYTDKTYTDEIVADIEI